MSGQQTSPVVLTGLRGRDGSTASVGVPSEFGGIPMNKALECLNVDTYRAGLARKRSGSASVSLTCSAGGPFASGIISLGTHIPGTALSAAELWAVDGSTQVFRMAGASTWAEITVPGALLSQPIIMLSFNGKLFMAFDGTSDRLLVWDGTVLRPTGMQTPVALAAPTNTGSGSYAATLRYYRMRYTTQSAGVTLRRGEASASTSFTPSGSGTGAVITKSAATTLSEGETHWELEVSLDNAVWYLLATTAVGTTTYTDSAVTTTYSTNALAPLAGAYTNWAEVTLLSADENRLIGAIDKAGTYPSRVWWSPVLGTTSASFYDDERVPDTIEQKNYLDIDAKSGAFITALSKPFQGGFFVFKNNEIHKLIPTGVDTAPFRRVSLSSGVGCFRHETVVYAPDEAGQQSMYWLSHNGPYRISPTSGLQFLGDDIQDVWDTINLDVCYGRTGVPHGVYHAALHQIWWWIPVSGNTTCNRRIKFDVRQGRTEKAGVVRDGWYVDTGTAATAACSVMFASTTGASMAVAQKPYIGLASGTTLLKCDTTDTDDNGTSFQAYVDFPDRHWGGLSNRGAVTGLVAIGSVGSQTLRATVSEDYGLASRTDDATIAATGSETRKRIAFEGVQTDSCDTAAIRIGDSAANTATWTLDAAVVTVEKREARIG